MPPGSSVNFLLTWMKFNSLNHILESRQQFVDCNKNKKWKFYVTWKAQIQKQKSFTKMLRKSMSFAKKMLQKK